MQPHSPKTGMRSTRLPLLLFWSLLCSLAMLPSIASAQTGVPFGWGDNQLGQLGLGYFGSPCVPVQAPYLKDVVQVAPSGMHNLALKSNGMVLQWGGSYPNTDYWNTNTPTIVPGLTNIVQVACSGGWNGIPLSGTMMAVRSDGTLWGWGMNSHGELGEIGRAHV